MCVLKRCMIVSLVLGLLLSLLGCSAKDETHSPDTLTLTIPQPRYAAVVETLHSIEDLELDVEYYCGMNGSSYLAEKLSHGDISDIVISTVKFSDEMQKEFLLDLSGYDFTGNYDINTLNMYEVDHSLYMLPGPMQIRSMAYNKTLFEEYGWKAPTNHQELVALVKQIRAESDLTPITFSAAGTGFYFTTMTTLAQTGFLSTPEGCAWEKQYFAGEVSCEEGFHEGIVLLQDLIDANAYDIDQDDGNWDGETIEKFVKNRDAAMMAVWSGQSILAQSVEETSDEFGLFPFYGVEEGSSFLGATCMLQFGLSKRLAEPGNEKKLEKALEVMKLLSTPEGMNCLTTGVADIIPLNGSANALCPLYQDIWQMNLSGHKSFMLYSGYEDIIIQASEYIKDAMCTGGSLNGLTQLIDEAHREALAQDGAPIYGTVAERFSREETAQLHADVLQSVGTADFSLLSIGGMANGYTNKTGAFGKLYEGGLDLLNINITIPHGTQIMTLTLTGADVKYLIENGHTFSDDTGTIEASFPYYWSGLNVQMEDGVATSIQVDGKELDMDQTYTVAFVKGDYADEIDEKGSPTDSGLIFQDVFIDYIRANSPLTPPEVH